VTDADIDNFFLKDQLIHASTTGFENPRFLCRPGDRFRQALGEGVDATHSGKKEHAMRDLDDNFVDDNENDEEDVLVDSYLNGAHMEIGAKNIKTTRQCLAPSLSTVESGASGLTSVLSTGSNVLMGSSGGGIVGTLSAHVGLTTALTHVGGVALQSMAIGAAPILGPVGIGFMLLEMGISGFSAAVTYKHISHLKKILIRHRDHTVLPGTEVAILYAIKKKNKKLLRKGLGVVPMVGSLGVSVYTLGRSIKKRYQGTRGDYRRMQARTLWANQLQGDHMAIAACKELLGKVYPKVREYADGFVLLKKKIRSM
jgi:hypothetical protein